MKKEYIKTLNEFISLVENSYNENKKLIFRGQSKNNPLLPKIARPDFYKLKTKNITLIDYEK